MSATRMGAILIPLEKFDEDAEILLRNHLYLWYSYICRVAHRVWCNRDDGVTLVHDEIIGICKQEQTT